MDTFTSNEPDKKEDYCYEEAFVLPVDYKYFNTEYEKKTVISWNAEEFSDLIHQLGCTPVAFITTIIGNAIYKNYDAKEKKVLVSIPVDLRPFYQSKAQANFFTGIKLELKKEYKDLHLKEQVSNIQIENTFNKNGIKVQVQDYGKIRMDTIVPYQFEKK